MVNNSFQIPKSKQNKKKTPKIIITIIINCNAFKNKTTIN